MFNYDLMIENYKLVSSKYPAPFNLFINMVMYKTITINYMRKVI